MGRHSARADEVRENNHGAPQSNEPGAPSQAQPHTHPHTRAWRIALSIFIALCGLFGIVGGMTLWPGDTPANISPEFRATYPMNQTLVDGVISHTDQGPCSSPSLGVAFDSSPRNSLEETAERCDRAIVDITSGQSAGKHTLLITHGQAGEPTLEQGAHIRLSETLNADGAVVYAFADYDRHTALIVWAVLIIAAIIAFAAWRGVRALGGLAITFLVVAGFLLPVLVHGKNPLFAAMVSGALILIPVVFLVHGWNWKSASALGGTLVALGLAGVLAHYAISTNQLRGLGSEDNLRILLYLPDVSVTGLMLCGFVIGALGVLNDVTISQASTINELSEIDPSAGPLRLFLGAMRVGRDHIASMVYTLVLTYTGAALPMLLLVSVSERPFIDTLTSDIMTTELLRSGVGALALTLAVPVTTMIAAFTVPEHD